MGKRYRQFSLEERCEIARLSGEGHSIRQIAAAMDRAPSSVARELKRNSGGQVGYKPAYAEEQARARRWSGSRLDRDAELREMVLSRLGAGWSPEQIAGRSGAEGARRIGTETIYRFIYAQIVRTKDFTWRHYLPRAKAKRGWRGRKGGSPALHMRGRVPLSQRPGEVGDRLVPGHWEADLMAFSRYNQNLLMLHERTSRVLIGTRLSSKQAEPVARAIADTLRNLPQSLRRSVTFDNGTEFARHHQLKAIGTATYFCDPHAPWQKGGIENAIGRMRRILPRKTDIANLTEPRFLHLLARYNSTPRKCLDWKTPAEAFSNHLLHFERESTSPLSRGRQEARGPGRTELLRAATIPPVGLTAAAAIPSEGRPHPSPQSGSTGSRTMRGTTRIISAGKRDEGAGGFIVWIVVYAVFMVALIALNGGSHGLGFHDRTVADRFTVR